MARSLFALVLSAAVAQTAVIPLAPGTYVLEGTPCADPPFAATFDYDGRRFSYPHASHCRLTVTGRTGNLYTARETCSALGDGTSAKPTTMSTQYRLVSRKRIDVRQARADAFSRYRWCSPLRRGGGA